MSQAEDLADAKQHYELMVASIAGRQLLDIAYWDIHNYGPEPRIWDYGDWHHAVMGVDLTTDSGPLAVLWTDTFFPYGVEVFDTPVADHLRLGPDGPESWSATPNPHWQARLGSPVLAARTFWEQVTVGPAQPPGESTPSGAAEIYAFRSRYASISRPARSG